MIKQKFLIILIILILNLNLAAAACSVQLSDNNPIGGQLVTAIMVCTSNNEEGQDYTLTWIDETLTPFEIHTGTTPDNDDTPFFDSTTIPLGITSGTVTLTGTNLEGSDTFTVTDSNTTLIIDSPTFTDPVLIGKTIGINFDVKDENNNSINGAVCEICGESENGIPIGQCGQAFNSVDGNSHSAGFVDSSSYTEDREYLAEARCLYDSNGDNIMEYSGSASFPFTVSKWLDVNTLVNSPFYQPQQEIFICANVTNKIYNKRLGLLIYHQIRCSGGLDQNNATDRAIIVSDDNEPDRRGISFNTTQNQCKKFIIPSPPHLQGKNSSCYASTRVEVIDEVGINLISYETTSEMFNLISTDLNINPDWEYLEDGLIKTEIDLNNPNYHEYNGSLTSGNLDIRLDRAEENTRHEEQFTLNKIDLDKIIEGKQINNIKAYYCNGTEITNFSLEYLNDGNLEIELKNVDLTRAGCYEISFNTSGDGKMYLVVAIVFISIICFLFYFSSKFDFEYISDKGDKVSLGVFKYLIWIVCSWLFLGIVNIAIKINSVSSLGLENTINALYSATSWIVYIFSAVFIFYYIYRLLVYFGGMFSND